MQPTVGVRFWFYRFCIASEAGRDGERHVFSRYRMEETDALRMKAHPSAPAASVEQVSENRASEAGGRMNPDLMRTSCKRPEFHQCQFRSAVGSCAVVRFCLAASCRAVRSFTAVRSFSAVKFCPAVHFARYPVAGSICIRQAHYRAFCHKYRYPHQARYRAYLHAFHRLSSAVCHRYPHAVLGLDTVCCPESGYPVLYSPLQPPVRVRNPLSVSDGRQCRAEGEAISSRCLPDAVLKANLQRLKQMLASDNELSPYSEDILWKNAERMFEKNE